MTDFSARREMMVDTQVRPSDVTKFPIIEAMLTIPREEFVPSGQREAAYADMSLPISPGRVMIEPRTLAKMLDAMAIGNEDLVMVVGAGRGYSAAVVARMAEAVVAVEDDADLVREAEANLPEVGALNVVVHEGPLAEGAAEHGPYDAIIIEGGVEELPEALTDQLKDGGRIACLFMDGALGTMRLGIKLAGHVSWRFEFNASAPVLPGFGRAAAFAL